MPFMEEQAQFLRNEGVVTNNIFISTRAQIPSGPGPYLSLFDSPGMAVFRMQDGGWQRPSAQIVARAATYEAARDLVLKAYGAYVNRLTGKLKVVNRIIGQSSVAVSTLVRVGAVATVTTATPHRFITGMQVTLEGADQAEYNGDKAITVLVTEPTKFTFAVAGSPTTPATGTILALFLGTFYQEIAPDQEPYDLGLDGNERVRLAFNISAVKAPS